MKLMVLKANLRTSAHMCILSRRKNSIGIDSWIRIYSALRASYIRIYESIEFRSFSLTLNKGSSNLNILVLIHVQESIAKQSLNLTPFTFANELFVPLSPCLHVLTPVYLGSTTEQVDSQGAITCH